MKAKRLAIINKQEKDAEIFKKVSAFLDSCSFVKIFSYVSMPAEVDTFKILEYYINKENGKYEVFIPKTVDGKMSLVRPRCAKLKIADKFGNVEGVEDLPVYEGKADVSIVPMLAFNESLYRLGYGGGYYDKFLSKNKTFSVGLAYDEQKCGDFMSESCDVPLDMIITPSMIYKRP